MREEREREKWSWDSGETERAFFLTTRARCLLWPSRWTRKSLAQPGPPGRAGIRIRRRQGKIVHQARPGGRAGRQAGGLGRGWRGGVSLPRPRIFDLWASGLGLDWRAMAGLVWWVGSSLGWWREGSRPAGGRQSGSRCCANASSWAPSPGIQSSRRAWTWALLLGDCLW